MRLAAISLPDTCRNAAPATAAPALRGAGERLRASVCLLNSDSALKPAEPDAGLFLWQLGNGLSDIPLPPPAQAESALLSKDQIMIVLGSGTVADPAC